MTEHLGNETQIVVFKLGEEEFGVNINNVREIVRLPEITHIPKTPVYVKGISNLRGDILPIMDTRTRFALEEKAPTERTRVLVVDINGTSIGLIVDEVTEVIHVDGSVLEPPPRVTRSVDKQFLDGVVKLNNGQRLVLTLNLPEIINIEITKTTDNIIKGASTSKKTSIEKIDEEQIVSFQIAEEEYAFNILRVREILRVSEITAIPDAPDYVKGLLSVRNKLLPILDLRTILGTNNLVSELHNLIDMMKDEHKEWLQALEQTINSGTKFSKTTDPDKCELGRWLNNYHSSNANIMDILKQFKKPHAQLHKSAERVLEIAKRSKDEALNYFNQETKSAFNALLSLFDELKQSLTQNVTEDQRILVVETNGLTVGFLVDHVNEVMRIPKGVIDEVPAITLASKQGLKGVAKLNDGKRLIMIIDETNIFSQTETEMLSKIGGKESNMTEKEDKVHKEQDLEEEHIVTFSIDKEEFGIRITQIQEINRLSEITKMPKAPYFIEGITNLRGDVVPVIDIRKRFNLPPKEVDERTRVIIVDIAGEKTGLIVDKVNEVVRLPKSNIEKAPSIISSGVDLNFIDGIGKVNNGKRMIVILNVERILTSEEQKELISLKNNQ